jgi:hypothetical protein
LDPMRLRAATSIDMTTIYPSREEAAPHYDKDAQALTTEFLSAVRKHVVGTLREHYGSAAFDALTIEWMVTVPAVWSPDAKNTTKRCAEAAGMGSMDTLLSTSEPEAAAVYALKKLEPHSLKVGNNLIVLDAGGGTVDLVAYRIKSLNPRLQLEESGVCTGGKCGGVFVNRVFESMIFAKLGEIGLNLPEYAIIEIRKYFETYVK